MCSYAINGYIMDMSSSYSQSSEFNRSNLDFAYTGYGGGFSLREGKNFLNEGGFSLSGDNNTSAFFIRYNFLKLFFKWFNEFVLLFLLLKQDNYKLF